MKHFGTSLIVLMVFTIILGGIYPLVITGVGAVVFPSRAGGSLVVENGQVKGSALIGQDFSGDVYCHPRPSAVKYDASSSGASNLAYTSTGLKEAYEKRLADWQASNGGSEPPMEMLFASGSGLDPDISPKAAELQAPRVAAARHLSAEKEGELLALVQRSEIGPQLGFLGEPRVNVLELNLALDREFPE
jgi:K+-transporting ATPase ATPase C chain